MYRKIKILVFCCFLFAFSMAQSQNPFSYSITKELQCSNGAVVSAHPLASNAGLQMLMKGGNAVDAAIATQLALAVVYPGAGNIGGGGFMVAHLVTGENIALDYRETAPAKATRDMYLDADGNPQMSLSQAGHLSAGVPGTVAGLFASMKYAKLNFKIIITPAIELASKGFALTQDQANDLNNTKDEFLKYNTAPVAFVKNAIWKAGDTLKQPELAATLMRIRDKGQAGFYSGKTAQLIVAEMKKGNGIISLTDLKKYKAKLRPIQDFMYKGHRILTMPLPSSGGIILQQMLAMIENKDIEKMGFQTPASVQLMTEVERRAYADRAEFLGDPDFVKVPTKALVNPEYLKDRMADFVPGKAGSSDTTKAGLPAESMETTHLSVIDKEGNAVSVTTTLNAHFGSKTIVAGAGFVLNDEMDDFSVKPGVANMYGAVGNEKNAIAPGKRMLSSMTPTLVLKDGFPLMSVGTPGGTMIPTSVYQSIVNVIDFKMSPSDAVNAPKFHHQWLPDVILLEKGFNKNTAKALKKMGYKTNTVGAIGRTEMIYVEGKGFQQIIAIADHRGNDSVSGY